MKTITLRAIARDTLTAVVVFGLTFLLAACTDMVLDSQVPEPNETTASSTKLRHGHLLDFAVQRSGKRDGRVHLIMGIGRGLEKQRVLERYKVLTRYRVLERYEYDDTINGYAISAADSTLDELMEDLDDDPDIDWYEPDIVAQNGPVVVGGTSRNSAQVLPWGVSMIGGSYRAPTGIENVHVFVLDSGVLNRDLDTVELLDLMAGTPESATDVDGHGTHVAGTIAAGENGSGIIGVAPGAKIHGLKVVPDVSDTTGDDTVELSVAIAAVEHITEYKLTHPNTPVVVNISLGAEVQTAAYNALDEAIQASIASGVTYVIAAGNGAVNAATVTPAHVVEAITVGAHDANNRFAAFSNYGSLVDILAPGVDIISLDTEANSPSDDLVLMSGTSMAAPHVTGAVARFLAENPHATPAQVRDALLSSGRNQIGEVPSGTTRKTVYVGVGGISEIAIPPFMQYAVLAGTTLKMRDVVTIQHASDSQLNANVYGANELRIENDKTRIHGFGYYVSAMSAVAPVTELLLPAYNPTGLTPNRQVEPVEVPWLDPGAIEQRATITTYGLLELSGDYVLGTREELMIWYVSGDVITVGDVHFSGYGVLVSHGDMFIEHNITNDVTMLETTLGLYAGGQIRFKGDALELSAQFFSNASAKFLSGKTTLYGNITTGADLLANAPLTIHYREASSVLIDPIWPRTGNIEGRIIGLAIWNEPTRELVLGGKSEPYSTISVDSRSNVGLGTVSTDQNGKWSLTLVNPAVVPCAIFARSETGYAYRNVANTTKACQ